MSEMLLNQQRQLMTNEEIAAQMEGQELANFKQLTFQESLNTAIEKMQDMFTNIAEGPLGMIAGFFADILSNSYAVNAILGAITITLGRQAVLSGVTLSKAIGTAIASIWSGTAGLGPVGWALAGGATAALLTAVASGANSAKSVDDAVISPGGGIITTHPDDYLIATKDPQGLANSVGGSGGSSAKVESLLEQLVRKNSNVYMDSSKVGYAEAFSYSKL